MSLEEIARATRVSSGYLHALEADDFASLPVPVFTRGFIRAYCQTLGEAPEPALALYDTRADPTPAMAEPAPAASSRPTPSRVTAVSEAAPKSRGPLLVSFVLLVVLGVALFVVTLVLQSGRERGAERLAAVPAPKAAPPSTSAPAPSAPAAMPAPAATPAPAIPPVSPPGTGASMSASPPAAAPGGAAAGTSAPAVAAPATTPPAAPRPESPGASNPPSSAPAAPPSPSAPAPAPGGRSHRLIARTTQPTWMRVRTEDGRVSEETIPAGQVREWHSSGPFRITVGNAGGVTLEVDGRTLPPLGASGVVVPSLVVPTERP